MPWSSSEPKFKPELLRTGLKSSSKFAHGPELDLKFSLRFEDGLETENGFEPV
jgi:hypothetical protein